MSTPGSLRSDTSIDPAHLPSRSKTSSIQQRFIRWKLHSFQIFSSIIYCTIAWWCLSINRCFCRPKFSARPSAPFNFELTIAKPFRYLFIYFFYKSTPRKAFAYPLNKVHRRTFMIFHINNRSDRPWFHADLFGPFNHLFVIVLTLRASSIFSQSKFKHFVSSFASSFELKVNFDQLPPIAVNFLRIMRRRERWSRTSTNSTRELEQSWGESWIAPDDLKFL